MELVKTYGEIRKGDIVRRELGRYREFVVDTQETTGGVYLTLSTSDGESRLWLGPASKPIILVHRPWERSWHQPFLKVLDACRGIVMFYEVRSLQDSTEYAADRDERLRVLCEAVDAYELGKPEGAKQTADSYEDNYDSNASNRCLGADD